MATEGNASIVTATKTSLKQRDSLCDASNILEFRSQAQ